MVFNTLSASSKLLMIVAESDIARRGGDMATSDIFKIRKIYIISYILICDIRCASRSCADYRRGTMTPCGHKRSLSRAERELRGTLFTILHL
ncbi:hypothetical protein ACFW04_004648 [Cataglyphis niger]